LGGIEGCPGRVLDGDVEEAEQGGQGRLQPAIEGHDLSGHLFPDVPGRVAVADPEVPLEEIDERQIARGLAIRYGVRLEHQPVVHAMGVGQFEEEP
jgi:hypothetical protein